MGKVGNPFQPVIPPALPSQYVTGEGRGVSEMMMQKMMDDFESEGYVSFPLGFYKLCQNFSKFYAKIR